VRLTADFLVVLEEAGMSLAVSDLADTGLEVVDLRDDPEFAARRLHTRDVAMQLAGMRRLAAAFVDHPETILDELVKVAVELCGAESAGISMVKEDCTDQSYFQWVATAGAYSAFLNAELPSSPSACSLCLERGRPQLFRVTQRFFDLMGVTAPEVTDGLLLPWQVDGASGTIWIMAHGRTEAFDSEDVKLMQVLAEFAAMGVRQLRQQKILLEQATAKAAAAMANDLAHLINNPLQSLTNLVYLVGEGGCEGPKQLLQDMAENLSRLSELVGRLLALPKFQGGTQ
jgi:signal transduction histidine kinase